MDILLKPDLEKFVVDKVNAGQYADASDIVNEALEALKEQETFAPEYEEYLRREVGRRLEQLKNGKSREFDAGTIIAQEHQRRAERSESGL